MKDKSWSKAKLFSKSTCQATFIFNKIVKQLNIEILF
jgi:hypothetical protein